MGVGQEQNTFIIHDRNSMYSTPVQQYNVKVDNQNHKTKFDTRSKKK